MKLFQQPFDANTVKPQEAFEPIPEGWVIGAIRASEAKPTKDNESGYLAFEIEVLEGEHKGRKLFDNLNLWNKSVQASEIAQRQLSAYCHATGVLVLTDSQQLHGIPMKIKVGVKPADGQYEARNVIKAVKHIQDATQTTAQPAPFAAPAQPSMPAAPFGQNPALPPQPAQTPTFTPQTQQPAASQPWTQPAAAPAQQMPQQPQGFPVQQAWAPPMQQPSLATGGAVPPWRK
jgi:hypothetical protein